VGVIPGVGDEAGEASVVITGVGVGVGEGGRLDSISALRAGASKPAYSQALPWQALFEQNELLSVPPAFDVSWQALQDESYTSMCMAIQVDVR
jgi:hypothetical protein